MEITYTKCGDYLLPNLALPKAKKQTNLGRYARARLNYLKQNDMVFYTDLLMRNELTNHLEEIEKEAKQREKSLVKEMAKREGITEELKEKEQMKWVGLMNNISISASEIVLKELIYQ